MLDRCKYVGKDLKKLQDNELRENCKKYESLAITRQSSELSSKDSRAGKKAVKSSDTESRFKNEVRK